MGLLGGMIKTAAVAGTAQATRNAVNRHAARKNVAAYESAERAYMENAQPVAVAAPPPQAAPAT